MGLAAVPAAAAGLTPPSTGTILQQVTPPAAAPQAPGEVLQLRPPQQQLSQSRVKIPVSRLQITGNHLLPTEQLQAQVQNVPGHTVTLGELQAAVARISALYQAHGYPLAYAYLPAQSIRNGVVTVAVVEPRYDRIAIGGDSRLKTDQVRRVVGLKAGEPIAQAPLNRGLLLLNRTPGVRVGGTLVPGAQTGTSTLQLALSDGPLVRGSAQLDNYGNSYTGRTRATADLSVDNPLGYGGQLAFNAMTTEGGLLHAAGFNATSPDLGDGLQAGLYGSRTTYQLGGAFAALGQSGSARQLGVDLSYPVILQPGRLLSMRLDLLHNKLRQSSSTAGTNSRSHITLARLSLDGAYSNRSGGLTSGGVQVSRGRLTLDSPDALAADLSGPNARGNFWVGQLNITHNQPLPHAFGLQLGLSGQLASGNLDGSQKFYLGGQDGVMSYPVGEGGGDSGVLLRGRLTHGVPLGGAPGQLQAALLLQGGEVRVNNDVYPGFSGDNRIRLSGAGVGLDYQLPPHLLASLAYLRRLGSGTTAVPEHGGELWASLRLDL